MPGAPFPDHFSGHAGLYARARPRYPDALFAWLAAVAPHRRLAWDAGTGNGQAAVALAAHFARVAATDASARQLAAAAPHPAVTYRVLPADRSPVPRGAAALVTAAQAAHWFDLPAFFAAARRALAPRGVIALWGYGLIRIDPPVDALVERLYRDVVGPFWPPERRQVEDGYRSLPFPFDALDPPPLEMSATWDLRALAGYLRSWSATQRFAAARGADPVATLEPALAAAWGDPASVRPVRFPLFIRAGRVGEG